MFVSFASHVCFYLHSFIRGILSITSKKMPCPKSVLVTLFMSVFILRSNLLAKKVFILLFNTSLTSCQRRCNLQAAD